MRGGKRERRQSVPLGEFLPAALALRRLRKISAATMIKARRSKRTPPTTSPMIIGTLYDSRSQSMFNEFEGRNGELLTSSRSIRARAGSHCVGGR